MVSNAAWLPLPSSTWVWLVLTLFYFKKQRCWLIIVSSFSLIAILMILTRSQTDYMIISHDSHVITNWWHSPLFSMVHLVALSGYLQWPKWPRCLNSKREVRSQEWIESALFFSLNSKQFFIGRNDNISKNQFRAFPYWEGFFVNHLEPTHFVVVKE